MTAFAQIDRATRELVQISGLPDPEGMGPPAPTPHEDGFEYRIVTRLDYWKGRPTPTSVLHWLADADEPHWVETASVEQALADAIARIDAAADAARLAAIGDPARALEYQRAEAQARAYRAAGYAGEMPRCVRAWADPKGWTGQQAADDIIATADAWLDALDAIREQRLAAKEAARAIAADPQGAASAVHAIKNTFLTHLKTLMANVA